jgi:hypothetical protein
LKILYLGGKEEERRMRRMKLMGGGRVRKTRQIRKTDRYEE